MCRSSNGAKSVTQRTEESGKLDLSMFMLLLSIQALGFGAYLYYCTYFKTFLKKAFHLLSTFGH